MDKRLVKPTLFVFVVWVLLDYVIHEVLLKTAYAATATTWRAEPLIGLIFLVTLVSAVVFVHIFVTFVSERGVQVGIKYGTIFAIGAGTSFAYGSYAVLNVPYSMALVWFLGTVIEGAVAGWIVGTLVPEED